MSTIFILFYDKNTILTECYADFTPKWVLHNIICVYDIGDTSGILQCSHGNTRCEKTQMVIWKMKLVTLHVPETYISGLEKLVENNLYPNRSEAIRIAIRDLLKRELWG